MRKNVVGRDELVFWETVNGELITMGCDENAGKSTGIRCLTGGSQIRLGFSEKVEDKLNEKVADTDWELGGDHYAGETNLGDFATDAT
jgi:hypothetical protein